MSLPLYHDSQEKPIIFPFSTDRLRLRQPFQFPAACR
jgi:hypothetical protein